MHNKIYNDMYLYDCMFKKKKLFLYNFQYPTFAYSNEVRSQLVQIIEVLLYSLNKLQYYRNIYHIIIIKDFTLFLIYLILLSLKI